MHNIVLYLPVRAQQRTDKLSVSEIIFTYFQGPMLCTETAGNVYILEAAPQLMRCRDICCSLSWIMVMKTAVSSMLILKAGCSFCLPDRFVNFADISIIFLSLNAGVQAK